MPQRSTTTPNHTPPAGPAAGSGQMGAPARGLLHTGQLILFHSSEQDEAQNPRGICGDTPGPTGPAPRKRPQRTSPAQCARSRRPGGPGEPPRGALAVPRPPPPPPRATPGTSTPARTPGTPTPRATHHNDVDNTLGPHPAHTRTPPHPHHVPHAHMHAPPAPPTRTCTHTHLHHAPTARAPPTGPPRAARS